MNAVVNPFPDFPGSPFPRFKLNRIEGAKRPYDLVQVSEPNASYRLRYSFGRDPWTDVPGPQPVPFTAETNPVVFFTGTDPAINVRIEKE